MMEIQLMKLMNNLLNNLQADTTNSELLNEQGKVEKYLPLVCINR